MTGQRIRVGVIGTGRIADFAHLQYDQGVAFLRTIRGETTDYPTFRDGAEAQRVVDAVDTAGRERRWITVPRD